MGIFVSGSDGETEYSQTGSAVNNYTTATTGSCTTLGEMQVVTSGSCQRFYICLSGSGGNEWVFVTGSVGCASE